MRRLLLLAALALNLQTQFNDVRMAGTTPSIGGSALLLGACSSGTVAIPAALVGQNVVVNGSDGVPLGGSFHVQADVTSNGLVTVNVCAVVAGTPTAKTYNVRVLP